MKSPPTMVDDCDDIFGPPRTYPTGYCPPKNRPSMISAKYRQKEERRKVLKISINKLKKIEDPEASLCRSVLINNTMKRLQKEARKEKLQKQQINYPRCYQSDFLSLSLSLKSEEISEPIVEEAKMEILENDFDRKLAEEIETVNAKNNLVDENIEQNYQTNSAHSVIPQQKNERKRSFDDVDDCDVQDVLCQFYMPPTPRMLTSIDEDEDVNVVDDEPLPPKRPKYDSGTLEDSFSSGFLSNNNNISSSNEQRSDLNSFSCGQASLFNDFQSNVYHSLIASLET